MNTEHYDAYAAARSALAGLARTSPIETFGTCHDLLLELDALYPEPGATEIGARSYPTRTAAWLEAKESIRALAVHEVDGLGLALLAESLERARSTERALARPGTRRGR
jgi:hypothetical protein